MELLTNYIKGFHARYPKANRGYEYAYHGNQGQNIVQSVDTSSQESDESVPSHMESTLEEVLEKVLSTEKEIQDLHSKLLDLTTTLKSHDEIIEQLEDRMNDLASQVAAQTNETNTSLTQTITDDDIFEREIVEESTSTRARTGLASTRPMKCRQHPANGRWVAGLFQCTKGFKSSQPTIRQSAASKREPPVMICVHRCGGGLWVNYGLIMGRPLADCRSCFENRRLSHILTCPILHVGITQQCINASRIQINISPNTMEVPVEVSILVECIMDHVHINVGELIADQFKLRAKKQDKDVRADSVITLATKTVRDAPAMKRAKSTMSKTQPPPSASSTTSTAQFHPAIGPAPTP
ncbi:hypothetical protein HAX54_038371 [Datura stramonium]|uniref:Uncharacterized protein n=1 Tax=Datura stramonium TaxID=4076 RepID=A0ABS8VM03_DATST|nr:hypothetical protein [Datura stramonium]